MWTHVLNFVINVYYVSFFDDSSRKSWIYFMKVKDEAFGKFQEFKALGENIIDMYKYTWWVIGYVFWQKARLIINTH